MKRTTYLWLLVFAVFCLFSLSVGCLDDDDDDDDDNDDDDTGDDDDDDNDTGDDDDDDDTGDDDDDDDTGDDDDDITGCLEGDYDPYYGVLHAHTSYSDGEQLPEDAFEHARNVAMLDIMIVTDHLEQLYFPFPSNRYGLCQEQADAADDPGNFLADCGFEYGSGFLLPLFQSTGHNNVFFSEDTFPMIQLDFRDFYQSLIECPECIGQFNHPGDDETQTWNDFEYYPEVDLQMNLFEFNGGGPAWELLFMALDAGWHVSPMYNQDNHDPDWGTKDDRRSVLYMADLERDGLKEAMESRRTFMTYDKNAGVRMMAQETCWMGSILEGVETINLEFEAWDVDEGDGFSELELYGPGMELIETFDCADDTLCTGEFSADVTESTYYVLLATQTDGDWLVAAPVWVAP